MHPLINHLIQLQELSLIRDEQKVAAQGKHLQQLDASIKTMTASLPPDTRAAFLKLHKRDPIAIAAISNSHCAVCGMQLAISFIQAVRIGRELLACPNCARLLFYPTAPLRRISKAPRRTAPRKVGIARFSAISLMLPHIAHRTKEDAIKELALKMAADGFVDNGDQFHEEALRREAILSTAVEHGIAFPHVRGVDGGGLALALATSPKGIKWGGSTKESSKLIFLIAIPTAASAFYLKLLAGLAETFVKEENRKAVLDAEDPDALWKILNKVTRSTIK